MGAVIYREPSKSLEKEKKTLRKQNVAGVLSVREK